MSEEYCEIFIGENITPISARGHLDRPKRCKHCGGTIYFVKEEETGRTRAISLVSGRHVMHYKICPYYQIKK